MKHRILISCIFLLTFCKSSPDEIRPEDIEFSENRQEKFYAMDDKRNKIFLEDIRKIQEIHESFSADFSLRLERYLPKKDKFYADGKIYFSKPRESLRIQLMDNFFGIVFSDIFATDTLLQVRDSKSEKIHSQPMGDLFIYDPARDKEIQIPFPVIYYSVTGSYLKEFSRFPSFFSPEERRVLVRKNGDEFTYFFDDRRLNSLEWYDRNKSTRAIATAIDSSGFPPVTLVTKVLEEGVERETFIIVTKLRNIKRTDPPDTVFSF